MAMLREVRKKYHRGSFLALLVLLALLPPATAAPIPIDNASFEAPALESGSWTDELDSWIDDSPSPDTNGFPDLDSSFIEFIPSFSAAGNQHLGLDLNPATNRSGTAYQDLTTHFQPATTYTLTVHAGRRNATHTRPGNQSTYAIETTDGTILASSSIDVSTLPDLTFVQAPPLTFTTPAAGGPTGPVRLRLTALGTGRSHFDNIQLDASPATTSSPGDATFIFANAGASAVSTSTTSAPLFFPTNAWSIDYDPYDDKIYWSDIDTGEILRADRNGANQQTVITIPGALLRGVQVDSLNDKIYFIQKRAADGISNVFTSDLDGNNIQKLNPFVADFFVRPNELALDRTAGCLFISDSGLDIVGRFDLAPAGFDIILGASFGAPPVGGPWGLATDPESATLYVSAYDNGDLIAVDYAGADPRPLHTTNSLLRGTVLYPNARLLLSLDASNNALAIYDLETDSFAGALPITYANNSRDLRFFLNADRDGDFLDDLWEIAHLGNIATSDGTTNLDNDQKDELGEFAFGTDPNTPDQDVTLNAGQIDAGPDGTFAFSFLTPDSSILTYNIYLSDDLDSWALLPDSDYTTTTAPSSVPGYSQRNIAFALGSSTPRLYFQVGASTR